MGLVLGRREAGAAITSAMLSLGLAWAISRDLRVGGLMVVGTLATTLLITRRDLLLPALFLVSGLVLGRTEELGTVKLGYVTFLALFLAFSWHADRWSNLFYKTPLFVATMGLSAVVLLSLIFSWINDLSLVRAVRDASSYLLLWLAFPIGAIYCNKRDQDPVKLAGRLLAMWAMAVVPFLIGSYVWALGERAFLLASGQTGTTTELPLGVSIGVLVLSINISFALLNARLPSAPKLLRLILWFYLTVSLGALILSGFRSITIITLGLLPLIPLFLRLNKVSSSLLRSFAILILILACLFLAFTQLSEWIDVGRLWQRMVTVTRIEEELSWTNRIRETQHVLQLASEYPIFGYGFGYGPRSESSYVHSIAAGWLLKAGMVGLTTISIYVCVLLYTFQAAARRSRSLFLRTLFVGCLTGTAAIFVSSTVSSLLTEKVTLLSLALFAGIAAASAPSAKCNDQDH